MNEKDFSRKIVGYLEGGLPRIDDANLAKLRASRAAALDLHREPVWVLGLVTVSGQLLEPAFLVRKPLFWLPVLAAVVAVMMLVLHPQPTDELYDESGALDAKLLTGELPIDAFLDKDFATWVKEIEATPQP